MKLFSHALVHVSLFIFFYIFICSYSNNDSLYNYREKKLSFFKFFIKFMFVGGGGGGGGERMKR